MKDLLELLFRITHPSQTVIPKGAIGNSKIQEHTRRLRDLTPMKDDLSLFIYCQMLNPH